MLTTAFGAKPYRASKLFEITRNSCVASAFGKGAANNANASMLETPSNRYHVLPWRPPPAEAPLSVGNELVVGNVEACDCSSLVTPVVRKTRLDGSRPLSGSSLMEDSPITWLISAVVALITSAPALTVVESVAPPSNRETGSVALCPIVSVIPVCTRSAKPSAFVVMLYWPD